MKDGGQAFPWGSDIRGGMTLRDWFAGQELGSQQSAAEGILGRIWERLWWGPVLSQSEAAIECYELADEMLAARALRSEEPKE